MVEETDSSASFLSLISVYRFELSQLMITFDFDETLTRPIWNFSAQLFEPSETPNHDSIDKLRSFHELGKEIVIVTTRFRSQEIFDFVKEHSLPISSIHCTEGELKGKTLKIIGSELHFDDSKDEAINNKKLEIPTIIVSYHFDRNTNHEICKFELFK